jgi:hypothetical protein
MVIYTCSVWPFHNMCQHWTVMTYELQIYITCVGMALYKINEVEKKYYLNLKVFLVVQMIASFVFWLLCRYILWRDDVLVIDQLDRGKVRNYSPRVTEAQIYESEPRIERIQRIDNSTADLVVVPRKSPVHSR